MLGGVIVKNEVIFDNLKFSLEFNNFINFGDDDVYCNSPSWIFFFFFSK